MLIWGFDFAIAYYLALCDRALTNIHSRFFFLFDLLQGRVIAIVNAER